MRSRNDTREEMWGIKMCKKSDEAQMSWNAEEELQDWTKTTYRSNMLVFGLFVCSQILRMSEKSSVEQLTESLSLLFFGCFFAPCNLTCISHFSFQSPNFNASKSVYLATVNGSSGSITALKGLPASSPNGRLLASLGCTYERLLLKMLLFQKN